MKWSFLVILSCLWLVFAASQISGAVLEEEISFLQPRIEVIRMGPQAQGDGQQFHLVTLAGCPCEGNPGAPLIPVYPVKLLLPQGHRLEKIEVMADPWIRLPGAYLLPPSQHAFPLSMRDSVKWAQPDPAVYESSDPYPASTRTQPSMQWNRGFGMVTFSLFPVRYVPGEKALYYTSSMKVRVHSLPGAAPEGVMRCRALPADRSRVCAAVRNPAMVSQYQAVSRLAGPVAGSGPAQPVAGPGSAQPSAGPGSRGGTDMGGPPSVSGDLVHKNHHAYVIITNQALAADPGPDNFQDLMALRTQQGLTCNLKTVEEIYAEFPGADLQEKIRNFCIFAYENWDTEYILLGGDGDGFGPGSIIPARGFYATGEGYEETNIKADLYYGNLDGDFDYNQNHLFGELGDGPGGGEVDLVAELYVGRAPVANSGELHRFVAKVLAHAASDHTQPGYESALFVGEFLWSGPSTWGGDYMDEIRDGCSLWGFTTAGYPAAWFCSTLYERDAGWSASQLANLMNSDAYHMVNHLGHANTSTVMKFNYADVDALTNSRPFFAYSQGCTAGDFSSTECMGERFVTAPCGAFGVIMNDKYGWGEVGCTDGSSQYFHREFVDALFSEGICEAGRANADSKEDNIWAVDYKSNRWCLYETNLLGDPACRLVGPLRNSQGTVHLDRSAYKDGAQVRVTVVDTDLNTNPHLQESLDVEILTTAGDLEWLTLLEGGKNCPAFNRLIPLAAGVPLSGNHTIDLAHGQTFTVTYLDGDDGLGGTQISVTAQGTADFVAPVLSGVQVVDLGHDRVEVAWTADEPVTGTLAYGMAATEENGACSTDLTTQPRVKAEGLIQCSDYLYHVIAADAAGNETREDGGGANYLFSTLQRVHLLDESLDEDPGWSISGGKWAWGQPQGEKGDPGAGHTGLHAYGYNLAGPYENNMPARHLTTPALDSSAVSGTTVEFWRFLTVDGNDEATLSVSVNSGPYIVVYENPISPYVEPCWRRYSCDISHLADKKSAVRLRWTMGPTTPNLQWGGWNIDDVRILGAAQPFSPWPEYESHTILDRQGNQDSCINPGETIRMPVKLKNTGIDAPPFTAVLKAYAEGVTLIDDQASYPGLIHLESGESLGPHFTFQTGLTLVDGEEIAFVLDWTAGARSGTTRFTEKVHSPRITLSETEVQDSGHDNDGLLDPGETAPLAVSLTNEGSTPALNVIAQMSCSHPQYVTLLQDTVLFGTIGAGETVSSLSPHFTVQVSPTTPNYTAVVFHLSLVGDNFSTELSCTQDVTDCTLQEEWKFDNDPGWLCEDEWAFGKPKGNWCPEGCPDPDSGFTGLNVYGVNLNGGYSAIAFKPYSLTSLPVDCSSLEEVRIRFRRWLGVAAGDRAAFAVSADGAAWTPFWEHEDTAPALTDGQWITVEYDISGVADLQSTVYFRWRMGGFGSLQSYCGWNVDDVELWGK